MSSSLVRGQHLCTCPRVRNAACFLVFFLKVNLLFTKDSFKGLWGSWLNFLKLVDGLAQNNGQRKVELAH